MMKGAVFIVSFLMVLLALGKVKATSRPILGVLAQETYDDEKHLGDMYIPYNYIQYLESAGARVVPIKIGQPQEYYINLLKSINGVLFPGGGVNFKTSDFYTKGKFIYDWAIEANDAGDYFPLWGTCQGFELMSVMTGGFDVLSSFSSENIALPLNFTSDYKSSRLFGEVPADVEMYLEKEAVTANFHHLGLAPQTYLSNSKLHSFYRVLSTNWDKNEKVFISTMEANKYPFYATQWHPEKNNFAWSTDYRINHGPAAVRVSQYMANFLVAESRKSNHSFPDLQTEVDAMMYNYSPIYSRSKTFSMNYYFRYNDKSSPLTFIPFFK